MQPPPKLAKSTFAEGVEQAFTAVPEPPNVIAGNAGFDVLFASDCGNPIDDKLNPALACLLFE